MSTHDRFLELAATAVDFDLADGDRALLTDHLGGCKDCRIAAAALRADARSIEMLVPARLDARRAARILDRALEQQRAAPPLRLVLIAALVALLAFGLAVVGAQLLRDLAPPRLAVLPPPSVVVASPTPAATPAPSEEPWAVSFPAEAATSIDTSPVSVARSGAEVVAVGGPGCTASSDGLAGCWIHVRRSTDGVAWKTVSSGDLAVGTVVPTAGPRPGAVDIAGGPAGFVMIGYAGDDKLAVAIWTSKDGENMRRAELGTTFAGARVEAVTSVATGWLIVGRVQGTTGVRGAAWTSADGRTWSRVPDSAAFDVGGAAATLEEPAATGPRDVAAEGNVVVAVGSVCDTAGTACHAATWRSADAGTTWARGTGAELEGSLTRIVRVGPALVGFGEQCKDGPPCYTAVASSRDGATWTETVSEILPAEARVLAAVPVEAGVVAVASAANELIVVSTRDGTTWEILHRETYQPSPDATPPPGYATVAGMAGVSDAEGGAIFTGYVTFSDDSPPQTIVIKAGPGVG